MQKSDATPIKEFLVARVRVENLTVFFILQI